MPDAETKPKKARIKSIADILQFWEDLRAAALDKADHLGPAAPQLQALEELIPRAREMRARHEALKAEKLQLTKDFTALRKDGKEVARRLQFAVKANLGSESEWLTQFRVKPLRPRSTSKAKEEKPPGGETPVPTPGPPTVQAAQAKAGDDQR
ncbi:MAG TPA: hypothetical protein VIC28_08890 [Thermoanaerobaculia bacterium]|jgi:hypothetical protein